MVINAAVFPKQNFTKAAIDTLPNEILFHIFSYLPIGDHVSCQLACRSWRKVSCDRVLMKRLLLNNPLNLAKASSAGSPLWNQVIDRNLKRIYDEFIYFGPEHWQKFFGDVEPLVPMPKNIKKILTAPCPIFQGKKVYETHCLIYIPEKVNNKQLTLKFFRKLIEKPINQGNSSGFHYIWDDIMRNYGFIPQFKSQWILMTKQLIPDSCGKTYQDQMVLVKKTILRTNIQYKIPSVLTGAIFLTIPYISRGVRLEDLSFFICQESLHSDWRIIAGGYIKMEPWRLFITTDANAKSASNRSKLGVALVRKL